MIYSIVIEERNIQFDALDTHDDYVYQTQNYIQQKQDETLQEMETRFNVQEKERQLERNRKKSFVYSCDLLQAKYSSRTHMASSASTAAG